MGVTAPFWHAAASSPAFTTFHGIDSQHANGKNVQENLKPLQIVAIQQSRSTPRAVSETHVRNG
jgi:hypothetical protein